MLLIIFPFLPTSVNQCYRSYKNRVYKSKPLRDFLKKVDDFFKTREKIECLKGNVSIHITFELKSSRKRDLDNLLKSLFDSLEGRLFENDNQIFEISCRKKHECLEDKTIITIFEI